MQNHSMSLTEVMRVGDDGFYDTTTEYVLMPTHNHKIKLTDDIFFEINIHYAFSDEKKLHKQYSYKLSIQKNKTDKINEFIKKCEDEYIAETENKSQLLFEFIGTCTSHDKTELVYNEVFFKSNKYLEKNIFCENKQELIEYIDQFKRIPDDYTRAAELRYEHFGMTFKATMLLYGPPGCGKSSFIRGILNRTGKYGIYVQWSKIKTCAVFTSIFRSRTINGKKLELGDLCFIFEDFDANSSQVLKTRELEIETKKEPITLEDFTKIVHKPDDELSLDCILNTLDGVNELHNCIIIFTTNYIDRIDAAFMRSGRIDKKIHFNLASSDIIKEIVEHNYNDKVDADLMLQIKSHVIPVCDVQSACILYKTMDECIRHLITTTNA